MNKSLTLAQEGTSSTCILCQCILELMAGGTWVFLHAHGCVLMMHVRCAFLHLQCAWCHPSSLHARPCGYRGHGVDRNERGGWVGRGGWPPSSTFYFLKCTPQSCERRCNNVTTNHLKKVMMRQACLVIRCTRSALHLHSADVELLPLYQYVDDLTNP